MRLSCNAALGFVVGLAIMLRSTVGPAAPTVDPLALDSAPARPESAGVAWIQLTGDLTEVVEPPGMLGTLQPNLRRFLERLDKAQQDDRIQAVWLRPHSTSLGRAPIHEIRQALHRLRAAGKRVYAELQIATPSDYLIAAACDEVWMPESAFLLLPGVRMERSFYKGLLDKLHIEAEMMQIGDFKGAAEPFTRTEMSDEFRGQINLVVDDLFEQLIEDVARDRGLSADQVRAAVDIGLLTAASAHERQLIDRVAYATAADEHLASDLGVTKIQRYPRYGQPDLDADFSGMSGLFKLMELFTGGGKSQRGGAASRVAVVYALGPIMPGKSTASLFGESTVGGDTLVEALIKAEQDASVAAIVLRVDSPGGSALASDLIWQQIRRCEKPIVASMGNMAASGGYYISMGCDRILAEPGTLTGSIGVVGGKIALGGLWEQVGISTDVISRGANAGLFSTLHSFTATERSAMRAMMDDIYRQFLAKAATSRGKSVADMEPLAAGRLWTGRQAAREGLVDEVGTLRDAIDSARELAGMATNVPPQLLILPEPKSFFEQLLEGPSADAGRDSLRQQLEAIPVLADWLRDSQAAQQLLKEPVLMWLPVRLEVR